MRKLSLALFALSLSACDRGADAPPEAASASPPGAPREVSLDASADAAPIAAAEALSRKRTPAERRKADEDACLAGRVEACRRMADRSRGYGRPSGCGIERPGKRQRVQVREGAAIDVRIKRRSEDTEADAL